MKKLLGAIFNRWVLAILGLIAIALLIWFVGPLIALADYRPLESTIVRWVLIGLIVLFYVGKMVWRVVKAKTANAKLMEGLAKPAPGQPQDSAGAEEVATLSKRFEEATGVLKQANLGGRKKSAFGGLFGKQYVYELPWYIFIGAPGSGKTTALINSGLQFPLAEKFGQEAIRGIGGTRNCDWWFTDEAVLLDTAGRYTTQESNQEVDSAAWSGFLQLLKKYRPRRPINGALVTVSVADLLQQSPAQREAQATALRKRIQELHEQLNIRFPIYVLVTKSDLLAGFTEFFNEYGKEERAQVWGMTFPYSEKEVDAQPLVNFTTEFAALEGRLNARLVDRLQQERDVQKRALLYTFPQQFVSIKDPLNEFLGQVFAPSRFQIQPLLRGVYFTSGTQEGNPIDRVMGALARSLKLERKLLQPLKPSGKSFFLNRLVKDVMFQEAGLAGTNLKWERRRTALQWGGIALALLITSGAAAAWAISYSRNKAYVADVQSKMEAVSKQVDGLQGTGSPDVVSLLPVLQSVQELANTSNVPGSSAPWSMGFGLYQGEKLAAASNSAYRRLLQDAFVPRIAMRMEQLLRTSVDRQDLLYESLKAYLMLSDPEHFDAAALKSFIVADWDENLPREVTTEQRAALQSHLDALLERGQVDSPIVPDTQLIAATRAAIGQTAIERRIYNRVRREGVGSQFPEFTVANVVGANAGLVFRRASGQPLTKGVQGLFSYKGYYDAFVGVADKTTKQLADEEGWVLGLDEKQRGRFADIKAKDRLLNEVRRLYLEDYANTWEAFVKDLRISTSSDMRQTIQTASILSGPTSPLPVLLRAIVTEVTLVKKADADKNLLEKGEDQLRQKTSQLKKLFGADKPKTNLELASQPEIIVDSRFDDLRRLVNAPAPGQPAPIDGQLVLLKELSQAMITAGAAIDANTPPPPSDAPNKAKLEANQSPEPLRTILATLGDAAAKMIGLGLKANVSGELAQLADFCNKAITGRYPFVRSSARDVTQDDFARVFSPGGELDKFFQAKLLPIVDTSKKPWSYRQVGDSRQADTSGALLQFQRAQAIRDVFFRSGGATPGMRLEFKPVEMDASITQFILDVDGQLVKYSHGPQVPQPVQWPGPKGSTQVRLQVSPVSASGASGKVFEGPWALFRLFDGVQFAATNQPEKFNVTFNIDGRKAQFEVATSSVQNPFKLRELEQFQCPSKL
jgi:type VI secretion system protein ImpL